MSFSLLIVSLERAKNDSILFHRKTPFFSRKHPSSWGEMGKWLPPHGGRRPLAALFALEGGRIAQMLPDDYPSFCRADAVLQKTRHESATCSAPGHAEGTPQANECQAMQNVGSTSMQTRRDDLATQEGVFLIESNTFLSGDMLRKLITADLHRWLGGFLIWSSACLAHRCCLAG